MGKIASIIRALTGSTLSLCCVHCGRTKEDSVQFISGPGFYICDRCSADAASRLVATPSLAVTGDCSFCGVKDLVVELGADRRHAICADCVRLIEEILAESEQ